MRAFLVRPLGIALLPLALLSAACGGGEGAKTSVTSTPASTPASAPASAAASTADASRPPLAPASPSATDSASAPGVRVTKHLDLSSIDALDAAYENASGSPLYESNDGAKKAQGCADFFALEKSGYAPSTTLETVPWQHAKVRCRALELVKRAGPVKQSHLRGFDFGKDALSILPASFAPEGSTSAAKKRDKQAAAGKTWAAYDPKAKIRSAGDGKLEVENDAMMARLELLAFGDFDGDGKEDVLVRALESGKEGTWFGLGLDMLTRDSPGKPLRKVALPGRER